MAARLKVQHTQEVRDKIKSSQLINFLEGHVLNGKPAQKSQVSAALGLLKKTLPDLQTIDGDLRVAVKHEQAIKELE